MSTITAACVAQFRRTIRHVLAALLLGVAGNAAGQAFPSKTMAVIMPIGPSSVYYITLRQMADQIQAKTGRTIVFDIAIGANGMLAATRVKRADPDGHTIGLTWAAPMTLNPLLQSKDQPYDPLKDFAYITMLTRHGIFFVAGTQFPPSNLPELVAYAKANPGKVRFANTGGAARVGGIQIEQAAGIKILDVPYRSGASLEVAAMTGEVDFSTSTIGASLPHIKAGKLKALFIGTLNRSAAMPNVMSISETYPNLEIISWYALYAPASTPAASIDWHHREWTTALKDPKIADRMTNTFGYDIVASKPEEVLEQVKRELPINARIVKQYNISE